MPEWITTREAVARAVLGKLRAALAPIPVERNLRETVHADQAPVVNFWDAGHTADLPDIGETAYEMELPVEATVTADTDAELGAATNDLYGRVLKTLMADPTLGGLCIQLTERAFDPRIAPVEESKDPLANFSLSVVAEFRGEGAGPGTFVDANAPPGTGTGGEPGSDTGTGGSTAPRTGSAFRHVQAEPSTVWTIRHNMGHYPNVVVVDTAGQRIYPGGESYPDSNTLILGFGVPFAGTADLD